MLKCLFCLSRVYNQRISLYTAVRRGKSGIEGKLGMDLTLNIYPEVRIGRKPNLRQIEFQVFCRFSIFELERGKHWFDAVVRQYTCKSGFRGGGGS